MHRIRLSCKGPHEKTPHAPFVGGTLELHGHAANVVFLVDTGADHTMLDSHTLRLPVPILKKGLPGVAKGVGGDWPRRQFTDAKVTFLGEDAQTASEVALTINVPSLSVLTPFAEVTGERLVEELGPVAPTDRRLQGQRPKVRVCPPVTPLLGRDLFYGSRLRIEWNPRGDSWILTA